MSDNNDDNFAAELERVKQERLREAEACAAGDLAVPPPISARYPNLHFPPLVNGNLYAISNETQLLCLIKGNPDGGSHKEFPVSTPVFPVCQYTDVASGKKWIKLAWMSQGINSHITEITIPLGDINRRDFLAILGDHGLLAPRLRGGRLIDYLTDMIPFAPIQQVVSQTLGWTNAIGLPSWHRERDKPAIPYVVYNNEHHCLDSTDLVTGDRAEHLRVVRDLCRRFKIFRFFRAASLASLTAADRTEFRHTLPLFFVDGEESTGKSFAMTFIASLHINPTSEFVRTGDRTRNRYTADCATMGRIPVVFDEYDALDENSELPILHAPQGRGRGRLSATGDRKSTDSWEACMFVAGNYPNMPDHVGAMVRITSIRMDKTVLPDFPEYTEYQGILETSAGWTAPLFYKWYRNNWDEYWQIYANFLAKVKTEYPNWSPKHHNVIALVMATAKCACNLFEGDSSTTLAFDDLQTFLKVEDKQAIASIKDTIISALDDWVAMNSSRIADQDSHNEPQLGLYAILPKVGSAHDGYIGFIPKALDEIIKPLKIKRITALQILDAANRLKPATGTAGHGYQNIVRHNNRHQRVILYKLTKYNYDGLEEQDNREQDLSMDVPW